MNRIPIPTDNIYKFYALFGLALIFASVLMVFVTTSNTNEEVFKRTIEMETLKAVKEPTAPEKVRAEILQKLIDIAIADKKFINQLCGGVLGIGIVAVVFGFSRWHMLVQPAQDELVRLQIRKLKEEIRMSTRARR